MAIGREEMIDPHSPLPIRERHGPKFITDREVRTCLARFSNLRLLFAGGPLDIVEISTGDVPKALVVDVEALPFRDVLPEQRAKPL